MFSVPCRLTTPRPIFASRYLLLSSFFLTACCHPSEQGTLYCHVVFEISPHHVLFLGMAITRQRLPQPWPPLDNRHNISSCSTTLQLVLLFPKSSEVCYTGRAFQPHRVFLMSMAKVYCFRFEETRHWVLECPTLDGPLRGQLHRKVFQAIISRGVYDNWLRTESYSVFNFIH